MSSKKSVNNFYITTAIDYSNSVPHVGHAFEKIGADVIARFNRLLGKDVFFLLGTDEHSQNVKRMAEKEGIEPKAYCDKMAEKFKRVWEALDISYTRFIQTTESHHYEVVQEFLKRVHDKGDIFKGFYEGPYCTSCEHFLDEEEDLDDNKNCKIHGIPVEHLKEENYFFKLSKYQDALLAHIKKHPKFIQPETRRNEILALIKRGLKDISISRQGSNWGIPLPFDSDAVAYVWVDALINYITGLDGFNQQKFEKYWPANVHVIGKDITRFHCVIWPCLLMSADITLPEMIWGHGFVHSKGAKMSKTRGTTVNPLELANTYGSDSLRYFLMREIPWDKDGDFLESRLVERHNAELSDGIGNLVSRIHAMIVKYFDGQLTLETKPSSQVLCGLIRKKLSNYLEKMEAYHLSEGLELCHEMIREVNVHIDRNKPWKMAKEPERHNELKEHLLESLVSTLVTSICLYPFCTSKMKGVFDAFELDINNFATLDGIEKLFGAREFKTKTPFSPLYPRIEQAED